MVKASMELIDLLRFMHFIVLLFIITGEFILPKKYLGSYLIFLAVTLVHAAFFKGRCVLTVLEEKLQKESIRPFNERVVEYFGVPIVSSTKFKIVEAFLIVGIVSVSVYRMFY